jgi:hypothetical protein
MVLEGWHFYDSKTGKEVMADEKKHSDHRALFHLHAGGLHKWAGISTDKEVPEAKKREAAASDNPHVQKMGQFALNAEHFKGQKKA